MIDNIVNILIYTTSLCLLDSLFNTIKLNGVYYLNHFIVNSIITYYTINDVINSFIDFDNIRNYPLNYISMNLIYSLHFYHIIMYYNKFKFDDWLHHILMIFICLPVAALVDCGTLYGYSMFFICGLPGGINYLLLFLQRNNMISRLTQKKFNKYLNLLIRQPGVISHFTLSILTIKNFDIYYLVLNLIPSLLVLWNGVYYMDMVMYDYVYNIIKN